MQKCRTSDFKRVRCGPFVRRPSISPAAAGRRRAIFASFIALVELRQVAGDDGAVHRPGITTAEETRSLLSLLRLFARQQRLLAKMRPQRLHGDRGHAEKNLAKMRAALHTAEVLVQGLPPALAELGAAGFSPDRKRTLPRSTSRSPIERPSATWAASRSMMPVLPVFVLAVNE